MNNSSVVTKSSFPIVLYTALNHPDKDLRNRLEKSLEDWLLKNRSNISDHDIHQSFNQCKGTELEPFYLKGPHLKASTILSKLAFTDVYKQNKIRIISEDTYGTDLGGCILNKDLSTKFFPIYPRSKIQPKSESYDHLWSYCPWKYPSKINVKIKTYLKIFDNGYQIKINLQNLDLVNWDLQKIYTLCRDIEKESKLLSNNINLNDLGCRVHIEDNSIIIETINTDFMLKLSAHLILGETLIIDPGPTYINRHCLIIKLKQPDQAKVDLFSTIGLRITDLGGWVRTSCKGGPDIYDHDKIQILKFTTPPMEWITSSFMEQI